MTAQNSTTSGRSPDGDRLLWRIVIGLLLGVICGLLFGEYCRVLNVIGQLYIGLLQMTVLPYVVSTLISRLAQLNLARTPRLAFVLVEGSIVLCGLGILLVALSAVVLPPSDGQFFVSVQNQLHDAEATSLFRQFVPENVFRSLAEQMVPAVVVFCMFFGLALSRVPGRDLVIQLLDATTDALAQVNVFLVNLAPIGLFALMADAAGTIYLEELSRLQAYLLMSAFATVSAVGLLLPWLVSCVTPLTYRSIMRAYAEPALTVLATGKLFIALPQIIEASESLLKESLGDEAAEGASSAEVVVPLAYALPHIGKIQAFVFLVFAAWFVGSPLTILESLKMATTGAVTSFSSPLVTVPMLLDQYELPQDVMPLFLIPGFLTTRMGDIVGVSHLLALTLISSFALQGALHVRWWRVGMGALVTAGVMLVMALAARSHLAGTIMPETRSDRLYSLNIREPYDDVVVHRSRDDADNEVPPEQSTLEHLAETGVLRVGYHEKHVPYTYFNDEGRLVGMDVEMMHRLARELDVRLEFFPWSYAGLTEEVQRGDFDLVAGGLFITPGRLQEITYSKPYQAAMMALVVPDHDRHTFQQWDQIDRRVRLAVTSSALSVAVANNLPDAQIVTISEVMEYFEDTSGRFDALVLSAAEANAWALRYPHYTVVVPEPMFSRPVALGMRKGNEEWSRFIDRWLDYEAHDGSIERLRAFWIEGGGTQRRGRRWSFVEDVLKWGSEDVAD